MTRDTWLTIGKITGVHGLAGNLKIWSYAQSPDTFKQGLEVLVADEGETQGEAHTIAKASAQKKGILLSLEGVTTREGAQDLLGKEILMNRNDLPDLEEDAWYWEDLIGLTVEDESLGKIGTIANLFPTGADDMLVVTDKDGGKETLIPMNSHFVTEVNLETGRLTTTLPEGFILE